MLARMDTYLKMSLFYVACMDLDVDKKYLFLLEMFSQLSVLPLTGPDCPVQTQKQYKMPKNTLCTIYKIVKTRMQIKNHLTGSSILY